MRLRVVVPVAAASSVKWPPTRIFPSGCTASANTESFAPGLKVVSSEPSALSRPMRLRGVVPVPPPPSVVKSPPTRILPSGCTASGKTVSFAPGLKSASSEPSALSRPMRLRGVVPVPPPPSIVKSPPTRILPSGCSADARTTLSFAPGLKLVSSEPSALSRPSWLRAVVPVPPPQRREGAADHDLARPAAAPTV